MSLCRFVAPLLAVFALAGCILVDDFSPQWKDGQPDSCTDKIAQALYYSEFRRDPEGKDMKELARSFTLGKTHFLMLKQNPSDMGGRLYRFGVVNGIFQRYRLNPSMRRTFLAEYPKAPVSFKHDTVTLAALGDAQLKLLTEISDNPEYWEIEDQTLYNVMKNPLCKFDDRDLKALAEEEKSKPAKAAKPEKIKEQK
ncbi:MAG: hypothetical protein ACOYNL_03170 [Rickettsiales bacterium]